MADWESTEGIPEGPDSLALEKQLELLGDSFFADFVPLDGNDDTETSVAQVFAMVDDTGLGWGEQEMPRTSDDVGFALCYSKMSIEQAVDGILTRYGQKPIGRNMYLEKGIPSGIRSQAIKQYTDLTETTIWDADYKDKSMSGNGIKLICNQPGYGVEWVHANQNNIEKGETRPRHDATTNGELVTNVLDTDHDKKHNKLRMWFMPPANLHEYDNYIPKPIKTKLNNTNTVVFVGMVYYDKHGSCDMLSKQEMQSHLVFRPASSHDKINCNDYVTFKQKMQNEWGSTHLRELSLAAVQFPKRNKTQFCFSLSIEFNKTSPNGVYEPVIFLLREDRDIQDAYELIPVVKGDMAVVCSDADLSYTSTDIPFTSNGFPTSTELPSTSTDPHQDHTNGKRRARSDGDALDSDDARLSRIRRLTEEVAACKHALKRIADYKGVKC